MKKLSDLKRSMVPGSKWHCYNHLYQSDMGIRLISRANSTCVYFWSYRGDAITEKFESRFDWPKSENVVFNFDRVDIYAEYKYNLGAEEITERKLILTYTKQ